VVSHISQKTSEMWGTRRLVRGWRQKAALSKNFPKKKHPHKDLSTSLRLGRDDKGAFGPIPATIAGCPTSRSFFARCGIPQNFPSSLWKVPPHVRTGVCGPKTMGAAPPQSFVPIGIRANCRHPPARWRLDPEAPTAEAECLLCMLSRLKRCISSLHPAAGRR
jgi:hypothetical protein